MLSIVSVQMAQANNLTTYKVSVTFSDTTTFSGNLTYDSTANQVTSLTGNLDDKAMGDQVGLTYLLPSPSSQSDGKGGILATVYAQNSTTVFASGSMSKTAGNNNASVTIDFNPTNPKAADINLFAYADCTPGGLMMKGTICTTGMAGGGTMEGVPTNQTVAMDYIVSAVWKEPMLTDDTIFTGSFSFDSVLSKITNLHGVMNSSMAGATPNLNLSYQNLPSADDGNGGILATVFKDNSTDVFMGGGYVTGDTMTGSSNAYATIDINPLDPTNVLPGNLSKIVYGDCTPEGLMGKMCMTGLAAGGTMGATPLSLTIKTAPSPGIFIDKDTSLTISLGANAELGQNADWWLLAYTPWKEWYAYVYPDKWVDVGPYLDLAKPSPAFQGPLQNISSQAVFNITGLASGPYDLYFGVDSNMNGLLDDGQLYYSKYALIIP